MAKDQKSNLPRIGLALSGGGYRAAAFHLGTLRKLHEMKILDDVDVLSTVSGGSIVGADYSIALTDKNYSYKTFETEFILKLKKSVIARILTSVTFILIVIMTLIWIASIVFFQLSEYPVISWIVLFAGFFLLFRYQFKIFPVSKIIEGIYDRIFFKKTELTQLSSRPVMAINSTNLDTGRQFTFSKTRMSDSTYDYPKTSVPVFNVNQFPVSRAVMASSCVPFAFTPVPINWSFFNNKDQAKTIRPMLIDGGVFDNQGMHKLTSEKSSYSCDIVITSDAGNRLSSSNPYKNVISLLIRSMDLFMNRIKNFQMMENLYQPGLAKKREIAYISLGWDLGNCVDGFIDNVLNGNIQPYIIEAHEIFSENATSFNRAELKQLLEKSVNYDNIKKNQQDASDLTIARKVGTNLTALSDRQIKSLINHAELMTELQVKLYCPTLVQNRLPKKDGRPS